jgi:hypothetical protein
MNAQVFVNFSSPREQVLALRLQALGSASGISVQLPQIFARQPGFELVPPQPTPTVAFAQLVIGIALNEVSQGFAVDMECARQTGRPTVVFAGPQTAGKLQQAYPNGVVVVDPNDSTTLEVHLANVINQVAAQQRDRVLLKGFALLAVGLILVASLDS